MQGVYNTEHASCVDEETNCVQDGSVQKAQKRVKFSEPLEYWKEFDIETGELDDTPSEISEEREVELTQHCKTVGNLDENQGDSSQNNDSKGGGKTQSITKVIHAFQKRQDKGINELKQAEEKRKDCTTASKQQAKLAPSGFLTCKYLNKRSSLCNETKRSRLGLDEKCSWNPHKESQRIRLDCTYSLSMSNNSKVPPSLPLVCTGRKIYDERLLPTSFPSAGKRFSPTKPKGTGFPPIVGKFSTPHIVQLFD